MGHTREKTVIVGIIVVIIIYYLMRNEINRGPIFEGSNFTWQEATKTNTGIKNIPNLQQKNNIIVFAKLVMQKVRDYFDYPVIVSSWFRSIPVNKAVGGSPTSDHLKGMAADIIKIGTIPLKDAFYAIKNSPIQYDQLIYETGTKDNPSAEWIHISWRKNNRRQTLLAPFKNGERRYYNA